MTDPEWANISEAPLYAVAPYDESLNGSRPQEDSWTPRNLAELEDRPPIEPTLGGLGLCYPGKRHVFSGPQESAKTLAAYVLGLSVVRAGSSVVLIDFEMGPWDAKTRLRELGANEQDMASVLYVAPEQPATESRIQALVEAGPELVIVDAAAGAYDLQELDDNKRGDVERFTRFYVNGFWKAGIATVVLDHVTKNAETRGNYAIGSERKVGGADVHLGFSVVKPISRGTKGVYKITTHKDRGGCLKRGVLCEFDLDSDPDTNVISWQFRKPAVADEDHPFRPTVKMEQASRWLEKQLEERVPMSHIEKGIGGDRDAGRLAIQILVNEGNFREEAGPRNARLMTLVRPYREEYDDLSATSPHLSGEVAQSDLSASPPPYRDGEDGGEVRSGPERSNQEQLSDDSEEDDGIPF
jgi:hypothetical protein